MPRSLPLRIASIALLLVLSAGLDGRAQVPGSGVGARREARIGVVGLPAAVDPSAALEGPMPLLARQVFDTLVAYREGSTDVDPALATRWSVSRDGLVWSFTLREGVKFSDGAVLTAAEAAASFNRHLRHDPAVAPSPVWGALVRGVPGVIKEVRAADARTLEFVLQQPYAPLLTVLAHPGFSITRAVGGPDAAPRFLGTGPYRIVDVSPGRIALEAVPWTWRGAPRSERLVFLEVRDDDAAEAEFDAGALDVWFPPLPPRRVQWSLSTPGLHVGYLAFQTEKEPFSRKNIRQAVAAALDPAVIGDALDRVAVPLQSFLPPGVWGRREGSPVLGGNREAAKRLLAQGGWPRGFTPTLLVTGDGGPVNVAKLAETLQQTLALADIPIQLRLDEATAARAAVQAGDHDVALAGASVAGGDPHLFLYPLSTSEGASKGPRAVNLSFYRNPRQDDILIRASQLSFRAERERLYRRAQVLLADDVPWIPIYVRLEWAVVRPEIRGLRLHPTGFHRLDNLSLEPTLGGIR
jgi:peptide/nickel transport system substrate-binding protein